MLNGLTNAARILPFEMREAVLRLPEQTRRSAEEIRLRAGRHLSLFLPDGERTLLPGRLVRQSDIMQVLEAASRASMHSVQHEIRRGFVTAEGGVRVGVCGSYAADGGIRDLSSVNIRIPCEVRGAGGDAAAAVTTPLQSVLVISPPGGGKTTFLRELVRFVSDKGVRVSLADERGEVAAVKNGEPQFDVGRCTDVMTGADKAEAAMMMMRAMSPQVIALDEISDAGDAQAIERISNCAVKIFATAHAEDLQELESREIYRTLLDKKIFRALVTIERCAGQRRYEVTQL